MTDWLFTWKSAAITGLSLLVALVVGITFQESTLANAVSIPALAVSVLGFFVTIWTVYDARHQIAEARAQAEQTIAQVREDAQSAVRGIAEQLCASDCAALRSDMQDLRQSAQNANWSRAALRCQECRVVAIRLAHDTRLTEAEKPALLSAADDLQIILRFIENNRLEGQEGFLQKGHVESLDNAIGQLAQTQARLHHQVFEKPA